jgi:phage shock protein E
MLSKKVTVVDVRTPAEYSVGHVSGSVNIPLNELPQRVNEISGEQGPVFLCCASGTRSSQAEQYLRGNGFSNVYDGGSWTELNQILNN